MQRNITGSNEQNTNTNTNDQLNSSKEIIAKIIANLSIISSMKILDTSSLIKVNKAIELLIDKLNEYSD